MSQEKYTERLIEENKNLKHAISHMSKQLAIMSEALRDFDSASVQEEYTQEYFWMVFANSVSKGSLKDELIKIDN